MNINPTYEIWFLNQFALTFFISNSFFDLEHFRRVEEITGVLAVPFVTCLEHKHGNDNQILTILYFQIVT